MANSKTKTADASLRVRVIEEAHEAVTKLKSLKPFLAPEDMETLSILIDRELMNHLEKSLAEAGRGEVEPIENILK